MENPQPSAERLLGAAPVACVACRKLKMRCVGAANPPCARCLKSKRQCEVRLPNRQQHRFSSRLKAPIDRSDHPSPNSLLNFRPSPVVSHSSTASVIPLEATSQPQESPQVPSPNQQNQSLDQTLLPSIFSSPPMTIAAKETPENSSPSVSASAPYPRLGSAEVPDATIRDLAEFFLQRMICYTPFLSLEPLDDLDDLMTSRRPLAYAMAFVASTLSLGYNSTRQALYPHMTKLLEQANSVTSLSQAKSWTLLQALGVIYSYPRVVAGPGNDGERQLSLWAVKSAVETCAMQISLHRSVEDLNTLIKSHEPDISSSFPYRRTFSWLWLFVKSRHHSIITRTPPTIQNDSTITSALDLLLLTKPRPDVWRVLAEAALHDLWDQAARSDKGLAEWWCLPPNAKDVGTLVELIENAESMLQEWTSTWLESNDMSSPSTLDSGLFDPFIFANSITAFMGALTRFSIVSFAAPIVSHQLLAKTGRATFPSSTATSPELTAFLRCVLKSADAASKCCDTILDLKPAGREILRYTPDYGFTMIALCCLHLVYAYNMSPDNPTLRTYLIKAEQVAYLLIDLRVGCNICPQVYGEYVLLQLQKATRISTLSVDSCNGDQIMTDSDRECAIRLGDSYVWPQQGFVSGLNNPPLYSLLHAGLANDTWPSAELNSDGLLQPDPELHDMFNIYADSLLHSNINSL